MKEEQGGPGGKGKEKVLNELSPIRPADDLVEGVAPAITANASATHAAADAMLIRAGSGLRTVTYKRVPAAIHNTAVATTSAISEADS